jgi:hypothetical protein
VGERVARGEDGERSVARRHTVSKRRLNQARTQRMVRQGGG